MSNNVRVIDIKNCTYYFFNDIVNIKHFDPNHIKSQYSYLLYWI